MRNGLTDTLQIPVDEVEAMKILQPVRNIHQLRRTVIPGSVEMNVVTHELDSIHLSVVLDELVDVTIIHPLRHQRKLRFLLVQRRAEQR